MTTAPTASANAQKTITTRLLILSDTHAAVPAPVNATHTPYRHPLPAADILLHAGDLTMRGRLSEYTRMLDLLSSHPAELKLVIAGNHDVTLDADFYEANWESRRRWGWGAEKVDVQAARDMWTGDEARRAGIVYCEEGVQRFRLSTGASFTIYTSPHQPEFYNWAFNYPHAEDRFFGAGAENPIPGFPAVDVVMVHGPPKSRLDRTVRGEEVGCPHLMKAVARCRPRLCCFGHIHEAWGAERVRWEQPAGDEKEGAEWVVGRVEEWEGTEEEMVREGAACMDVSKRSPRPLEWGRETLFVNASIMTISYRPDQAPWRVDLELPLEGGEEGGEGYGHMRMRDS